MNTKGKGYKLITIFIAALLFTAAMLGGCSCSNSDEPHSESLSNSYMGVDESGFTASPNSEAMASSNSEAAASPDSEASGTLTSKPSLDPVYLRAKELLGTMTLEEKVGQMFFVRCPSDDAVQKLGKYYIGGYILFANDFEGKTFSEAKRMIAEYLSFELTPFIAVDEEGGTVNRVSKFKAFRDEPFKSPQELYENGGFEAIRSDTDEKSSLLKSLGINFNFAPVCDISMNPSSFIYKRSFGKDANATSEYVEIVVEGMKTNGMGSVLKHFPGYGDNVDTHNSIGWDARPYSDFLESDFLPFRAGINAGADMVMVSHNIMACVDDHYPSSLSPAVHALLRNELNFDKVIITDDLTMSGANEIASGGDGAILAILAGNDMLCCSDFEIRIPAVIQAVKNGEISVERIDESVLRILRLKLEMGLIA